jgi:hypothetical protein
MPNFILINSVSGKVSPKMHQNPLARYITWGKIHEKESPATMHNVTADRNNQFSS